LRLLGITIGRCWWVAAVPIALTVLLLLIPQGHEFYAIELGFWTAIALGIVSFLLCALLGMFSAWLMLPQKSDAIARTIPAGWSFAAGLTALSVPVTVAAIIGSTVSDTLLMKPVLVGSVMFTCHLFTMTSVVQHPLPWLERLALVGWALLAALPIFTPWPLLGAVVSIGAYLGAHTTIARRNGALYLWSRRDEHMTGFVKTKFIVSPVIASAVLAMGWNNARDPVVSLGDVMGPVGTLLIALGFWMTLLFSLVWLGELLQALWNWRQQRKMAPGIHRKPSIASWGIRMMNTGVVVLVAALAVGHIAQTDVREADADVPPPAASASSVEAHLKAHIASIAKNAKPESAPFPVVIVAAEGGGVRAAFWTSAVLGALKDRYEEFPGSVVALSGVSGGSVGVTLYSGLDHVTLDKLPCETGCPDSYRGAAQWIAGSDFFSPALLSLLVSEPIRDLKLRSDAFDRAAALEKAFAEGFKRVIGQPLLEQNFCTLQAANTPLVLPGLTDARTGKRVVLTCLPRETKTIDPTEPVWLPAGGRVRASTAAFMSARFPVVSPTGMMKVAGTDYRFVDGGYSDNTGAGTAVEVLRMVQTAARELGLGERIRPVLLVLNTDDTPAALKKKPWDHGLMQLAADPLSTLDAVRARNAKDYRRWLNSTKEPKTDNVAVVEWRLPNDPDHPYVLGWLLSQATQESISKHVTASMKGKEAESLQLATGWKVQQCKQADAAVATACNEKRAKGER
jgi:hypothetical protein